MVSFRLKEFQAMAKSPDELIHATPAHVAAFNDKVAELIKGAPASQISDLISHPGSLLKTAAMDNQNQNQGRERQAQ
jgi:hypothetical protein